MDRQQLGREARAITTWEAQVEQLERGIPLAGMTLAESIADLTSLAIAGDWRTPVERERARGLVLRLASLGWQAEAHGVGRCGP
jgi:hypothetical protein